MGKKKVKIALLFVIPLLILGYLTIQGFKNSAAYYYTISEVLAMETESSKLRVKGDLVADSIDYIVEIPVVKFAITDGDKRLNVVYQDVLPDNFTHADEVIIEGTVTSNQEFEASKLMLQCPSKYEEGE